VKRELSAPPGEPVKWLFLHNDDVMGEEPVVVVARTWFEARAMVMRQTGAEPWEFKLYRHTDHVQKLIPAAAKMRAPVTIKAARGRGSRAR
jgi:hypothetical protein